MCRVSCLLRFGTMLYSLGMRQKTIFIIEDEPGIRDFLSRLLELEGYKTITASNGHSALEMLKDMTAPDLILLDVVMPEMNGIEFMNALKADHVLVTIPVAIVSAYDQPKGADGAKTFIKKPVDINALLKVIKEWCG